MSRPIHKNKLIVMLGTSYDTKGGVASVVNTYRDHGLFKRWPIEYIATHRDGSRFTKLSTAFGALLKYGYLLATGRIILVHAHTASRASFRRKALFIFPAFLFHCPVIFHLHGAQFISFYEKESSAPGRFVIRMVLNKSSLVVALSSQWVKDLQRLVPGNNIIKILNPVSVVSGAIERSYAATNRLLIFLGRLGKRKGVFDLIEAVSKLHKDYPDLKLLCGGDGDLEGASLLAKKLNVQQSVEILGWVYAEDKRRLLAKDVIYVLPSYNEGLPMGVLEAMAEGLPIVASNVGGIPDAVENGVEGFLVEPGDVAGLSAAIGKLLESPGLRKKMGEAGRRKILAQFTHDRVLPELERIYKEFGAVPVTAG